MTIQFLKDHTTVDGRFHRKGEVIAITDTLGTELVKQGIAKERGPYTPAEHKTQHETRDAEVEVEADAEAEGEGKPPEPEEGGSTR
jgi:hypothetical protein